MVEAVIFDMDGTLLNTLEDLYISVNFVMQMFNFPLRTPDEVRNFVGNGVNLLFERAVPEGTDSQTIKECVKVFKKKYSENMYNHTAPYDGILEVLKILKSSGVKIGIVSNKFDAAVKEMSKKYFGNLVDIAVGQADDVPQKPSPDGVLKVMRNLGVTSAVYVGDSDVDIMTAKNSNLPSIGVCWGFRDVSFLKGADFIVDKPIELVKVIRSL